MTEGVARRVFRPTGDPYTHPVMLCESRASTPSFAARRQDVDDTPSRAMTMGGDVFRETRTLPYPAMR
jgi:hypothetical protein